MCVLLLLIVFIVLFSWSFRLSIINNLVIFSIYIWPFRIFKSIFVRIVGTDKKITVSLYYKIWCTFNNFLRQVPNCNIFKCTALQLFKLNQMCLPISFYLFNILSINTSHRSPAIWYDFILFANVFMSLKISSRFFERSL